MTEDFLDIVANRLSQFVKSIFGPPPAAMNIASNGTRAPGGSNAMPRTRLTNATNSNVESFGDLMDSVSGKSEQDFRLAIMNALLRTPHRKVEPFIPLFSFVNERDPLFFGHLAVWYFENGTVNDLKQLFIAFLVVSKFSDEFRDAGIALLEKLPPFQVARVVRLIKGQRQGDKFLPGISNSVPRSLKTAVEQYLHARETNRDSFDNVVFHARKELKFLYSSLRIKPGEYAQKVLFDNAPPEDSRLHALKLIAKETDPVKQAHLIAENRLPYRVAVSGLKTVTPTVLAALVLSMSPQEVINNLASLKKRGVMENPDLKKVVEQKLEEAGSDKRVSALKTREAVKAAGLDADLQAKVEAVGDKQIKSRAKIQKATALHIDKSGSMQVAIQVGKQIAAIIAPICEQELYVYAFDTIPYEIKANGSELSSWEKAFKGIEAGGGTACGAAVEAMRKKGQKVEQIIMVTDEGENERPLLVDSLKKYEEELGVLPDVIIVKVPNSGLYLEHNLARAGLSCDTFTFAGDYYSLPSLLPLIAGGTRLELLMQIMDFPMPKKERRG